MGYDVLNLFSIGLGGRIVLNETSNRGNEVTSRLDFEISKSLKLGDFTLSPRVRYCYYSNIKNTDGVPSDNRFRYRLKLGYKYAKDAIIVPSVSAEVYHFIPTNTIGMIRYALGFDYKPVKDHTLYLGYMLDNEFLIGHNKHIMMLTYKYSF